ncbi:hypothetical protein F66182_2316 [Fusarium sp. NRRL 66182]|nr:hypothetical protein F66182_2316 [Fusarium sp. NRRL 66182]
MDSNTSSAESAASMTNLKTFNVEAFLLLGIALLVTALRSYVRISSVGFRNLWADDYLVVVGAFIYAIETGLAYSVGNIAHGLANNSMTDEYRASLTPDDPEYQLRVTGSKIQLTLWATYSSLLWILKAAMCTFYYRLTKDLEGYRTRVITGFALIIGSFAVVQLNLLLSCGPFHQWWQIYPDPGPFCHAAISPGLIWTYLSFSVVTDLYLIMIPMPMLWKAAMPWLQKVGLLTLFSCGLFVTMAAILRVVLLVSDPVNGAQLAGAWAVRETFVAVVTTNIPMLFPTLKKWAVPIVGRASSPLGHRRDSKSASTESRFSGCISMDAWRRKAHRSSRPVSSNRESVVRIVETVELSCMMLDPGISKPETSKPRDEVTSSGLQYQADIEAQAEGAHEYGRMRARSDSYMTSCPGSPIHSPGTEGSEFLLGHVHHDRYCRNV